MRRLQFVSVIPSYKQRKAESLGGATYAVARMPGLRRPMNAPVPAGAFPFGQEPPHQKMTDDELKALGGLYGNPKRA